VSRRDLALCLTIKKRREKKKLVYHDQKSALPYSFFSRFVASIEACSSIVEYDKFMATMMDNPRCHSFSFEE
jgi:hypothetical protein